MSKEKDSKSKNSQEQSMVSSAVQAVRQGQDVESGGGWWQVKKMKLSFEHDHVCIRNRTGFLLWQCKVNDFDPHGFDLADVLEAASINMPPDV